MSFYITLETQLRFLAGRVDMSTVQEQTPGRVWSWNLSADTAREPGCTAEKM